MHSEISLREIKKLRVAQTYCEASRIKSMDFHDNGETFVYSQNSSGGQKEVVVLRLSEKIHKAIIKVQKYGANICKFIDEEHIVTSSENNEDSLRLLNLTQTNYIRYFPGHSKAVISLSVSDRLIIASSKDSTVRLWDVRHQESIKRIEFPSPALVAFHPLGELFAVAVNSTIEIFSRKDYNESINKFEFDKVDGVEWKGLKFSSSGDLLMVTTNSSSIWIIDAIKGIELHHFRGVLKV